MTWEWTSMKIVNSMCSVTFNAKATNALHFLLMTMSDFKSGVSYYRVGEDFNRDSNVRYIQNAPYTLRGCCWSLGGLLTPPNYDRIQKTTSVL